MDEAEKRRNAVSRVDVPLFVDSNAVPSFDALSDDTSDLLRPGPAPQTALTTQPFHLMAHNSAKSYDISGKMRNSAEWLSECRPAVTKMDA